MKIQFAPSVYEHAASLIEKTPWEVSRDEVLLFRAHKKAHLLYKHSPIVVGVDIYNVEAEAYGATVSQPAGNGVPTIREPLFSSLEEAFRESTFEIRGRIPMILSVAEKLSDEFPGAVVSVPVSGPFSIALNLLGGSSLLENTALHPELVQKYLFLLAENQLSLCTEIKKKDLDIAFFESGAAPPLLSPEQFRNIEFDPLKFIISRAEKIMGLPVPCIIGGDTVKILDYILATGTSFVICPSETDQKLFMEKMKSHPDVVVRINMNPSTVRNGNNEDIICEIENILKTAGDRPNIAVGTGAISYDTPPGNIKFIARYLEMRK